MICISPLQNNCQLAPVKSLPETLITIGPKKSFEYLLQSFG